MRAQVAQPGKKAPGAGHPNETAPAVRLVCIVSVLSKLVPIFRCGGNAMVMPLLAGLDRIGK
jgi:hypothetical protein